VTKFKALKKSLELMIFCLINVHGNDLEILGDLMGGTTKWQ
jgi:rRNA processing protein Krr1/Pno1